jgi:hypothetical protein
VAVLTTKARNKLADTMFAEPAERKYPVNDPAHAKNALARAAQQEAAGNLSEDEEATIQAKANRVLRRSK